ncbi:MAG: hypothetical protein ACRDKY_10455 [Solirubrobacteraceae bacterium]
MTLAGTAGRERNDDDRADDDGRRGHPRPAYGALPKCSGRLTRVRSQL